MAHRNHGGGRGLRGLRSIFKARDARQTRRSAGPGARRSFRFEPLEPRVLLSVDLPTGAEAIIQQGLQSLSLWAHEELEQLDELNQILPLFGKTLGGLSDISDILSDNIYTPVNSYLTGGGTLTSQGLADALEAFLGSDVTDLSDSSRLLFEVTFHFESTQSVDLALGANKFGLELADGSAVDATISLDFDFSFGVDLTAGLAPSEAFFIEVPEGGPAPTLSVGLSVSVEDADNVSFDIKVGMLEATADLVNLDATATVDAALLDPNGDGMLTRAEWEGTPVSSVVELSAGPTSGLENAAVDATIDVDASLGTYSASGQITILDENLFDTSAPDIDFTAAQDLQDFSNLSPGDLVAFLSELGASLQGVASALNPSGGIPLLSGTLEQLANFEDLMADLAGGLYDIELRDAISYQAPTALASGGLQDNAVLHLAIITIGDNGQQTIGPEATITLTPGDVSAAAGATTLAKIVSALDTKIGATALSGLVDATQDNTDTFLILGAIDSSKRLFVRYQGDDRGMRQLGFTPRLANAVFRFNSVQGFIEFLEDEIEEVIPSFNPDVDYNTSSELTFDLEWQADFSRSLPLDFTQAFEIPGGLGTLAITGHVTAQAGAKASVNARVGLDLSPLGSGFTADAADTLASLNGGAGVQNLPGENDLKFTLRDGVTVFNVNLDSALDLGDVIDLIEGQSGFLMDGVTHKVDVSFIADDPDTLANEAVGLRLEDKTSGPGKFRIEAFAGAGGETSLAGLGLGILGSDVDGDGAIVGTGLHGDTLLKHAFIEDGAAVSTELTVSATGIYLTASLGILEAGITNGRAGFKVTGGAQLDGGSGRVSLADLVFGAGQASLVGDPGAADGVLASDATFSINVNGIGAVAVTVAASSTTGNTSLADLAFDLNEALKATSFTSPAYDGTPFAGKKLGDFLTATVGNNRISIAGSAVSQNVERVESLAISATNAQTNTKLGFQNGDSASSVVVNPTVSVMGTIDVADPDLAVRLPITVAGLEAFGIGVSEPEIVGDAAVATGVLTVDATFSISVDGITAVPVTVLASVTSGNADLADLVSDLNAALDGTAFTSDYDGTPFEGKHLGDFITATVDGTSIKLTGKVQSLSISATNAETNTKLGFQDGDADVSPDTRIDLTIAANSPISLTPELAGLDASTFSNLLAPFSDFSLASLLKLADQILEFIKTSDLGLFSDPLPLVDKSVRDILSFLDDIESAISTVKDAVAGFKNDALDKLEELRADGGPIDAAAAALTAGGEADLGERLLDAFEAIQDAVHALPDSLSDALEFPNSAQLASGLAALKATLRDITDNTSVNVDDLKKEVALLKNTIPSAATVAKYLFNLVGLDDLAGFDLQTLFDQKAALQTALTSLNATEVSDALKDKFKGVLDDLTGSLVESFADPDGSNPLSGSDISDWNPSAVLDTIGSLSSAIADLDAEITGMGDPDNDNEEAARDQIQAVLNALTAALPAALQVSFLESGGDKGIVFRFHYSKELLDESLKLDFQIPDAGDFIPFGVKTGGEFNIDLAMTLNLGFGLDFTDLSDPGSVLFLTGDTSFEVTALVDAPLMAEVTIGGIKASITGTLKLQQDVDDGIETDPAILKVTLGGTATDRVTLGAIAGSIDPSGSAGALKAEVDAEVAGLVVDNAIVVTADLPDFEPVDFDFNLDLSLAELDLAAIVQMIETFLGVIADGLSSKLMSELPLVGDIDFDTAATFIKDIRMTLADIRTQLEAIEADASDIEQQITDILNNALGSGGPAPGLIAGLGLITITDVTLELADGETLISDPNAAVTVRFQIGADDAIEAPFDAKLPALGLLSGDVGVDIALASTIDFGVRVSKTEGAVFLLNEDGEPEVHFGVTVNVIPEVVLDLFFLQLEITDNTLGVPELEVDVDIDLDYAGGFQVPLLDVSLSSFGFEPTFTTEVNLDLLLTASTDLIDNFPTLTTVFVLDWSFNIGNPTDPEGLTYVAFEDITLDLAGLLSGPIREIFEALDTFIDPLRPLLDFLNAEIPLISQVSQLVGQGPFTFLDGIRLLGEGGDTVATVVGILDSIADAVEAVDLDNPDPNIFTVRFGDYVLVDASESLSQANGIADLSMDLFTKGADLTSALATNWAEDAGYGTSYASDDAGLFGTLGDEGGQGMLGITFPLLEDPKQIVNLIFGKPVDLVIWDVPRLEAKFEFSQIFGPIIPPFPVFARIAGSFSIFADFLLGLDTRGLQTGNFINGLFLGDRTPTTPQGEDVPELGLTMEFTAGAELNIPFARAGVEGGIGAGIFANFHDPNNDGKFYLDEVLDRASMGPECIFDLEGAISVFLRAYLNIEIPLGFTSITIIDVDFTIIEVTLFDFSITCPPLPPPVPAHLSDGGSGASDPDTWNGDTTNLPDGTTLTKDATTFAAGTLILHAGSFSDLRQPGASDIADEIKIRGEGEFGGDENVLEKSSYDGSMAQFTADQVTASQGNGVVVEASESATGASGDIIRDDLNNDGFNTADVILVEAYGVTHVYTGVQRIVIDAGNNDEEDSVLIDAMSVRVPVTVVAGGGDDEIQTGTANDVILAGAGEDAIAAGAGDDEVSGGVDNDEIFGNAGADTITGDGGDDTIYGGDNDHVDAGDGADDIQGGDGNDRIYGALGNDVLRGQDGTDQVHGGAGADELHGGPEDDQLFGDEDADFAAPTDGVGQGDFMIGGPGNDQLSGGAGNDRMIGGGIFGSSDGGDLMDGGVGNDIMIGDVGDLDGGITLAGGSGNDTMIGGSGDDQMYGQGGTDEMYGDGSVDQETHSILPDEGSGVDYMEGNASGDTMFGGQLDDRMIGGSSSLPASGLDAADLMYGGDGADIMLGDNGTITGSFGNVATNAMGGSGADTMFGGLGDDVLFGGGRGDRLSGSTGNDVIVGDQGTRSATSITADHSAEANSSGDDILSGSEGMDTLLGGEGNDEIAGDAQVDIAVGDNGRVTLTGGVPTQIETKEFAFGGNDTITGSGAPDILLGGSGADLITGGGDTADDIMLGDNGVVRDNNAGLGDDNDIFSNDPAGAADVMDGGPGHDIMLGGTAGDALVGGSGDDLILGDHGNVERNASEAVRFIETVFGAFNGKDFSGAGGVDTISGKAGSDLALGGQAGDVIYGDGATPGAGDNRDILLGDNGEITLVDPLGPGAGAGPDAIVTFNGAVAELHSTDLTAAEGGSDMISGNDADDILAGGVVGDVLHGNDGADIALGDNALLDWLYAGGDPDFAHLEAGFTFDATFTTLDLIATQLPSAHPGGRDTIFGDAGDDVLLGGEDADTVWGDDGDETGVAAANDDILFGDHGAIYPHNSALPDFPSRNFFAIDTGDDDAGEGDRLFGEEGNDLLLGQQGDDRIFGGDDDDDLIGGHNVAGGIDELTAPAVEATLNPDKNDIMDGGSGDDALAGDNAEIWRKADETGPRFRALAGQTLYDPLAGPGGQAQVTGAEQLDPRGSVGRTTLLLDHTAALQGLAGARPWGADVMAGNSEHDLMFGQLGDELMQGDGSIDAADDGQPGPTHELTITDSGLPSTAGTLYFNVTEAATDGDDYLEGNGGADLAYGNLGQDDIIGGSSALFGLTIPDQRPDGSDTIFGGAGTPDRIARNAQTADDDLLVPEDDRHAVDSDTILGDNGAIYRIVGTNGVDGGAFLTFNYDALDPDRGSMRVIPRAVDLLDYVRGVGDTGVNGVAHGAGDTIHGESGDDIIHGMIGTDLLYGDSEDDDVLGEAGHDWATGGTGEDGVLGDDGFLFTSRNGDPGEPLHGVAALPAGELDRFIKTPGGIQQAILNVSGQLKKSVNLEPFVLGGDDILYGGLGDDFMHGGGGDDAISGAEALALSAAQVGGDRMSFAYASPSNPGDVLGFEAYVPDEFALYDEFEPLRRILLDTDGQLVKSGAQPGPYLDFLLNFEAFEDAGDQAGTQIHDGNDVLFGDEGNDWLVGGTDQDHMFGGFGADLMNADDNLTTNGDLNDVPDVPAFAGTSTIPGQIGADTAFGGGGRDVLLANTGADRLLDWVGEYNAYVVPFAPFGEFTVSRSLLPQLPGYLYALSKSDGADQTRAFDTGSDPARNGEPDGELALVLQQDPDWQAQTGAPDDPQAGNKPGGKKDTMEAADFGNGSGALALELGAWSVVSGRYQSAAGGEALSVIHVQDQLPSHLFVEATLNLAKPAAGTLANGYLIFDYRTPTDFKFAGLSASQGRLVMGQRTAEGWTVLGQANATIKTNRDYSVRVSLDGNMATLSVDGAGQLSWAFADHLTDGLLALGADNSVARFDEVKVWRSRDPLEYAIAEDLSDGLAQRYALEAGSWLAADGRLTATPVGGLAVSTLQLDVAAWSQLAYEAMVQADSLAGLVFDYQDPTHFKYAALLPDANQVILGHRTAAGWFTDIAASKPIQAGRGYSLRVDLDGTEARVSLDGRESLGWAYSSLLNDGEVGLLARGGAGVFDNMVARSDDPSVIAGPGPTEPRRDIPTGEPSAGPTAATSLTPEGDGGGWLIDARLLSASGGQDGAEGLPGAYRRVHPILSADREESTGSSGTDILTPRQEDSPWAGLEGDWLVDL